MQGIRFHFQALCAYQQLWCALASGGAVALIVSGAGFPIKTVRGKARILCFGRSGVGKPGKTGGSYGRTLKNTEKHGKTGGSCTSGRLVWGKHGTQMGRLWCLVLWLLCHRRLLCFHGTVAYGEPHTERHRCVQPHAHSDVVRHKRRCKSAYRDAQRKAHTEMRWCIQTHTERYNYVHIERHISLCLYPYLSACTSAVLCVSLCVPPPLKVRFVVCACASLHASLCICPCASRL